MRLSVKTRGALRESETLSTAARWNVVCAERGAAQLSARRRQRVRRFMRGSEGGDGREGSEASTKAPPDCLFAVGRRPLVAMKGAKVQFRCTLSAFGNRLPAMERDRRSDHRSSSPTRRARIACPSGGRLCVFRQRFLSPSPGARMPPAFPLLVRGAVLGCLSALPLHAQIQQQTLPAGFDSTPGNSGFLEPFLNVNRQVHHWVYDSAQFAATQPIRIRSISMRPISSTTSWGPDTYLDFSIALSSSTSDYRSNAYLRAFEDNTASLPDTLFSGDLTVPNGTFNQPGVRPWAMVFSSPTGYVYDPSLGRDFVIELRTPSRGGAPNPTLFNVDAHIGSPGTVGGNAYLHRTNPVAPFFQITSVNDYVPIVRIEYEPFTGANAEFDAAPLRGFGPLTVQFTDRSFTTAPSGIASYAWDFENDGIVDSTAASPTFTYTTPGSYSVRLRVLDGNGGSDDRLARATVVVHAPPTTNTASAEVLEYHFNEVRGTRVFNAASTTLAPSTGTLPVANWQADPQRAGFQGNEPGFGCLAADRITPTNQVVETTWALEMPRQWTLAWWQRRSGAHGPGEMRVFSFGADAFIETGGTHGAAMIFSRAFGGSISSLSGADSPAGVWTHFALLVDDAAGTAEWRVNGVPRNAVSVAPGSFRMRDCATLKIGGGGPATTVPFTSGYELDDVRLYARLVLPSLRAPLAPYLFENAAQTLYDQGCSTSSSVPLINGNSAPQVGNASYAIQLSGAGAGASASLVVGFTTHVFGLFPLDLSATFGPGCVLSPFPDLGFGVAAPLGSASFPSPIAPDPLLIGAHAYAQWLVIGSSIGLSPALDIGIR
ncbi:MAG: PKD domain-containing protein [Planctomycetes bacterium]|nr:PKD domain-containing protein [Planctomycetota bacterium]